MTPEFDLIGRYFTRATPSALLGVGDDCALLAPTPGMALAVTTDMLVSGTHFFPDDDPETLGWKALAVNLSDCAAMGARPRWALLAGALPEADESWLAGFSRGLFACADAHDTELVGGDTTRGPRNLCLTVIGEVVPGAALRRDSARAGDDLWVSGSPGRAALGLAVRHGTLALDLAASAECLAALQRPQPRVALGMALVGLANAALDVSDGLLADLGHMLKASAVGAEVCEADLPWAALPPEVTPLQRREALLAGGDDYELLFSAPATARSEILTVAREVGVAVHRIGYLTDATGRLKLVDAEGREQPITARGYDHFA